MTTPMHPHTCILHAAPSVLIGVWGVWGAYCMHRMHQVLIGMCKVAQPPACRELHIP